MKRYVWGIRNARHQAYSLGERIWFVFYGIASTCYRVFICLSILMFLNDRLPEQLFFVVPILAFGAVIGWVLVPMSKLGKYLLTGLELMRHRPRALGTAFIFFVALFWGLGITHWPDYCRIEGILEPNDLVTIYMEADGVVTDYLESGATVSSAETQLIRSRNHELEAQHTILIRRRERLVIQRRIAQVEEVAATQVIDEQIQAIDEQIARTQSQMASLTIHAPQAGIWFSPTIDSTKDLFLQRGQVIGKIGDMNELIVRATAPQNLAALLDNAEKSVEMRLRGCPEHVVTGTLYKIAPMGQDELPADALAYQVGGNVPVRSDAGGPRTSENIFEVRIKISRQEVKALRAGQRIVARVRLGSKPLLAQWYRSARQLFQKRFYI